MYQKEQFFRMKSGHFIVKLAESYSEFEEALRLRFDVFNRELNEGLQWSYVTGMDRDVYDDFCDHLIVVDTQCNRIVGTYRLLLGFVAENNKGYYSEGEFDLSAIRSIRGEKLELGRSCVHKEYRNTNVLSLLWAGIARYIEMYRVQHLFGCGSLHTSDPSEVSMVYSYMNNFHRAEPCYTVHPMKKLSGVRLYAIADKAAAFEKMPSLIKGYLRVGALLCGEPAHDAAFGTTDLFLLLETERVISRYRKRFFQETSGIPCPVS